MKNYTALFLALSFFIFACKNDVSRQENTTTRVVPFTEVGNQIRNEAAAKVATPTNPTVSTTPAAAKGMNPAHGQTGHRCDIPVGAPLNSPAVPTKPDTKKGTTPSMTVTPLASANSNTPVTPTPEGMNPAHGQEGHRCDIAVGAALAKE